MASVLAVGSASPKPSSSQSGRPLWRTSRLDPEQTGSERKRLLRCTVQITQLDAAEALLDAVVNKRVHRERRCDRPSDGASARH